MQCNVEEAKGKENKQKVNRFTDPNVKNLCRGGKLRYGKDGKKKRRRKVRTGDSQTL